MIKSTALIRQSMFTVGLLLAISGITLAQEGEFPSGKTVIVLVGDSTVTNTSGWGAGFAELLLDSAYCHNAAQSGRSSRSFRSEGHWDKVIQNAGDYVLIQFGHNDQPGKGPERESSAKTDFREHLRRYAKEAQAAGMRPILVTPLTRRLWNREGKIKSILHEYAAATREVAKELDIPLVDLHALSIRHCNSLGPKEYEEFEPVERNRIDHTHLNRAGSRVVGEIVASELVRVVPELAGHFKVDLLGGQIAHPGGSFD